ncbi:MAG: NAD-dependent epimerase/dehydratase family protein [Candidatus Pacearchaeota archaeon]
MEEKINAYKKNILILGGGGYIGLHLTKNLVDLDYSPTILTMNSEETSSLDFIQKTNTINGSITNKKLLDELVKGKDAIVNLVGYRDRKNRNPIKDLETNCIGELNLLESIAKYNPRAHHIFMGTREQFGKVRANGEIIDEEQVQKPNSFYGIHKKLCEEYLKSYSNLENLKISSLRSVGIFGPSLIGEPNHFTYTLIKKALNGEDLTIRGDGSQIQDFIYIEDLTNLITTLISKETEGIYNVGSGKGISMKDLAFMINKKCDGKGKIIFQEMSREEDYLDLDGCIMNIEKIKKETGWEPKTNICSGIDKTINWTKDKIRSRR